MLIVAALPRKGTMTAVAIMTVLSHRKHGLARADPEGSGHEFAAVAATAGTETGATR